MENHERSLRASFELGREFMQKFKKLGMPIENVEVTLRTLWITLVRALLDRDIEKAHIALEGMIKSTESLMEPIEKQKDP